MKRQHLKNSTNTVTGFRNLLGKKFDSLFVGYPTTLANRFSDLPKDCRTISVLIIRHYKSWSPCHHCQLHLSTSHSRTYSGRAHSHAVVDVTTHSLRSLPVRRRTDRDDNDDTTVGRRSRLQTRFNPWTTCRRHHRHCHS